MVVRAAVYTTGSNESAGDNLGLVDGEMDHLPGGENNGARELADKSDVPTNKDGKSDGDKACVGAFAIAKGDRGAPTAVQG